MKFHYVVAEHPQGNYTIRFPAFENDLGVVVQGMISRLNETENAKVYLNCLIWEKIKQRKPVPVDSDITQDRLVVLDWQTELRVRVSNRLIYNSLENIADKMWENSTRLAHRQVDELFDPTEELNLFRMLEVIRAYKLPFQIQEVKFKYE